MEGLIPLVYKSLKKSQTRRKYECLSSGAAAQPYNIADFYMTDDNLDREYIGRRGSATPGPHDTQSGHSGAHHRRCSSVVIEGGRGFASDGRAHPPPKKQIVRFRSHRMLSCITGA
ncbi:uncharacterized protein LOC121741113 [Salvia splendens]|uniref:uncharacterized protein LOC121741113 n=1 Tax=Salvia splendens TaxID=180675 RepID=UPI001C268655|nr:uncharacterized protein LOC121741113 [Salvia splendens]